MFNTRIAPSPTGDFHIGTARTLLFNYLAAKASGGKFILRIDDTDIARNNEDHVKIIYDAVSWLGLGYDLTFRQSHRFDLYRNFAENLISSGLAKREDTAIRLDLPENFSYPECWVDELGGMQKINDKHIINTKNMVLIKSDGTPTYHFATVIDDNEFDINYIIRGTDHIDNTARHVILYNIWKFDVPKYAHVGLIHRNKKKVSKRDSDLTASLLHWKEKGIAPEAMITFLLRLGWGPKNDTGKDAWNYPLEKAIAEFLTDGKMRSVSSNFDENILNKLNRIHLAGIEKALKNETGVL